MFRLEIIKNNTDGTISTVTQDFDEIPMRHVINYLSPKNESHGLNIIKLLIKKKINEEFKLKEEHTKLKTNIYF